MGERPGGAPPGRGHAHRLSDFGNFHRRYHLRGNLAHAFIRSECDEASVRVALDDAAPRYRDAPEAQEIHAKGDRIIAHFMRKALPLSSDATRELVGDLVVTTMTAVGKEFSATPRTGVEIEDYAEAMADMLRAYLTGIIRHHEAT